MNIPDEVVDAANRAIEDGPGGFNPTSAYQVIAEWALKEAEAVILENAAPWPFDLGEEIVAIRALRSGTEGKDQ